MHENSIFSPITGGGGRTPGTPYAGSANGEHYFLLYKGFFRFEIIINILVDSFRFIWIPVLWVYRHYKYFTLSVRGSTLDVRIWRLQSQILKSKDGPRAERVKVLTANEHYFALLKVIYHPLYSMNNFVTNKSKLPQDGAQVFPYMGWLAIMWPSERVTW